jgi:hypothetical protein
VKNAGGAVCLASRRIAPQVVLSVFAKDGIQKYFVAFYFDVIESGFCPGKKFVEIY